MPRAHYDSPPPELVRLGAAMRALREGRGMKQIEVATAASVTESQVSDIERGRNNPGWRLLIKVLTGMEADLDDLAAAWRRAGPGS